VVRSEIKENIMTGCLPSVCPSARGLGFDWGAFIADQSKIWSTTAQNILTQRNLARGVYTKTEPGGTTTYVQPEGTQQNIFSAIGGQMGVTGTASAGMGLVVVGGAALWLVFKLAKR
jgi:hypothetical protein